MNPLFTFDLFGVTIRDTVVVALALAMTLAGAAFVSSRHLRTTGVGWFQTVLEMFVGWIESLVAEIMEEDAEPYVPLVGTLILFIGAANLLSVIPVVRPPTGDLSVPVALAIVVFLAVPYFGIRRHGVTTYLRQYVRPHPVLLPLNLLAELTRTVALAIRLFGNMMSAQMVGAILVVVAGFLVPIPLLALGLLSALVQAYIFGVLTAVFIAAAVQIERTGDGKQVTP